MDSVTTPAPINFTDQESFAKWAFGMEPDALKPDAPEPDAAAEPADADAPAPDEPADAAPEPASADAPNEPDTEPTPEPVKLPFEAKAKDEAVDPSLLASMEITLKADGKAVTMPLADVVRRAQSEPAAQRQARAAAEQLRQEQELRQQIEAERDEVRAIAIKMARSQDYWLEVNQQIEQYDAPEARAARAEQQLAAERERQEQARQQAQFEAKVQAFAVEVVAPTLESVLTAAPLVKQEELLGKFYADTAAITVNGIIPPEYHADLAHYLRTEFADFAKARQAEETAREAKIAAEAKKSQMERQRLKNQTAQATKPMGSAQAPGRDSAAATTKPRTVRDAEAGALNALLGNLQ